MLLILAVPEGDMVLTARGCSSRSYGAAADNYKCVGRSSGADC